MLDFFDEIFSWLVRSLRDEFPEIYVSNTESVTPPIFPAVYILQKDNVTYQRTRDACMENHVKVMIQIEIYTNGTDNKESQGSKIRNFISDLMLSKGFNRTLCEPVPNLADMSIYRIIMRFTGVIGKDRIVYAG